MVITGNHLGFFQSCFFVHCGYIFFVYRLEVGFSLMFVGIGRSGFCVSLGISFIPNILAQLFVVFFVTILAFNGFTGQFSQLKLGTALDFDSFVCNFERLEQITFLHLAHLTFNHHNILQGGTYHNIHVGFFEFSRSGIQFKLSVNTSYADF
ncbi:MAG: hypothetical protein BWX77_01263 [Bacteroidetes bacterium ADurb.Bin090]|nr:MAG: hypothetical protein BWX77_01263 [Bacteroidetes bacterium ADurb.Bin090]